MFFKAKERMVILADYLGDLQANLPEYSVCQLGWN